MFQSVKLRIRRIFITLFTAGCALSVSPLAASATLVEQSLKADNQPLFAIHGSNTIGAHLAPSLVKEYLQSQGVVQAGLQESATENESLVSGKVGTKTANVLVAAHGSSTGYKALAAGQADIWASSRPVKEKEVASFMEQADLSALNSEHVIAIDGLAILVNPKNTLQQLSKAQLKQLFSGQIKNWSELGGPNLAVAIYARDEQSGTWDTFKTLVLGDAKLVKSAKRYESNDQLSDDVSKDPGGIGFTGFASVRESKALAIADGNSPAIAPSRLSIATEDYPLSRRLFFYTVGTPKDPLVRDYLEYVQSNAGQTVVGQSGFIEQNLIAADVVLDSTVPVSFKRMTEGYQRLSVNFRFAEGRTKLDNKAQRDLQRIINYLQDEKRQARDLMLIGFADQQSNEFRAQQISELRALSVQKALKKKGVEIKAFTGYGQYMQVAQSGGAQGASRNGRVEVWIKKH